MITYNLVNKKGEQAAFDQMVIIQSPNREQEEIDEDLDEVTEESDDEKPVDSEHFEPKIQDIDEEIAENLDASYRENMAKFFRATINGDQNAQPKPVPYIAEASQTGKVVIEFTR